MSDFSDINRYKYLNLLKRFHNIRFNDDYVNFNALEIENLSTENDPMWDFKGRHQDNSYIYGLKLLETIFNEINPENFVNTQKILNTVKLHCFSFKVGIII